MRVGPRRLRLDGPGAVTLDGRFQVVTATGTATAHHIAFASGPFTVDLVPALGGWQVTAVLQGPTKAS